MNLKAIWLIQLGTPDDATPSAVGRYLTEFLMDRRMIAIPNPFRFLLVRGVIIPSKVSKSTEAYQKIWSSRGSPLRYHSEDLVEALQKKLPHLPIVLSMRYGNPSLESGFQRLKSLGATEILVVPLFPQYSSSTNASISDKISEILRSEENIPSLQIFPPFFNQDQYIDATLKTSSHDPESYDRVLFSFHGYPESYLKKSSKTCLANANCCDRITAENAFCYRAQCFATANSMAKKLGLPKNKWSISFQSRLSGSKWTEPYTDFVLVDWAKSGVKKVLVYCPSFVADCLETLEEIGVRERTNFLNAGGQVLDLVPSVNASSLWVDFLAQKFDQFSNA